MGLDRYWWVDTRSDQFSGPISICSETFLIQFLKVQIVFQLNTSEFCLKKKWSATVCHWFYPSSLATEDAFGWRQHGQCGLEGWIGDSGDSGGPDRCSQWCCPCDSSAFDSCSGSRSHEDVLATCRQGGQRSLRLYVGQHTHWRGLVLRKGRGHSRLHNWRDSVGLFAHVLWMGFLPPWVLQLHFERRTRLQAGVDRQTYRWSENCCHSLETPDAMWASSRGVAGLLASGLVPAAASWSRGSMDGSMGRMRTPGHCVSDQVKFQPARGEADAMEDLSGKPIEDGALELLLKR